MLADKLPSRQIRAVNHAGIRQVTRWRATFDQAHQEPGVFSAQVRAIKRRFVAEPIAAHCKPGSVGKAHVLPIVQLGRKLNPVQSKPLEALHSRVLSTDQLQLESLILGELFESLR